MNSSPSFAPEFIRRLRSESGAAQNHRDNHLDLPSYNLADQSDVGLLVSSSTPAELHVGTGASIFTTALIPAILAAKSEVILVTCFWAESKTLSALRDALNSLASSRQALIDAGSPVQPLRIHICFSSRSLLQKLLHTSSRDGYTYPPSSWSKTLGLPSAETLKAAFIELEVKSLFFLPFSVMHPKFLIIDRRRAFIPSCNISWEAWLECCVEISGPAVVGLLDFFARTWNKDLSQLPAVPTDGTSSAPSLARQEQVLCSVQQCHKFPSTFGPITTIILPSSHHRNPDFRPLPWQAGPPPPPTPLNVALLYLIDNSRHSIYIQTPNLTSAPVVSALLDALRRGVHVRVVTNSHMMVLEQLVTAGTTTDWCLRSFLRRYRSILYEAGMSQGRVRPGTTAAGSSTEEDLAEQSDLEAQRPPVGRLQISYFQPDQTSKPRSTEPEYHHLEAPEEPVRSHLKLTVIDGEFTVLGSGNMDRASWYTSQELGILFQSRDFAAATMTTVSRALDGCLQVVFESP